MRPAIATLATLLAFASPSSARGGELVPPPQEVHHPIAVRAETGRRWMEGDYEVWLLHGDCTLRQGELEAHGRDAVLWIDRSEQPEGSPRAMIVYLENDVWMKTEPLRTSVGRKASGVEMDLGRAWLGRFYSTGPLEVTAPAPLDSLPQRPPVYGRGVEALGWQQRGEVQSAQFAQPLPPTSPEPLPQPLPVTEPLPPPVAAAVVPSARNVSISSRGSTGTQIQTYPGASPNETIIVVTGGVRVVVSGISGVGAPQGVPLLQAGVVTMEADRVVVWTTALAGLQLGGGAVSAADGRSEIYMEGNIVFKEGDRVVYADRMYYHVNENRGAILNAEMLTPVPQYEGLLRLKADVIQQLDQQNFVASGAALTSSRLGVPRYWFQSQNINFQDVQQPDFDPFSGQAVIDPRSGETAVDHSILVTSRNNFIYVAGFPVLYWPVLTTDATKPTFYVDSLRLTTDNVFGTQAMVNWDTYQVLGLPRIRGTEWTFSTDYLSDRGFGLGTLFTYDTPNFGPIPGRSYGLFHAWGIKDEGLDNLGLDRRNLFPEEDYRGRVLWRHRQFLGNGYQFTAELGAISDRNFLEQYYEREWDQEKDQITGIEFKRYDANTSWSIAADVRLNDFFTQTESLPRFDHYLVGQSVFNALTWYGHSRVGYEHVRPAVPPSPINPSEVALFDPLAWEADAEGLRAATRHEIDWPFQLGAVKVVPYALGEASTWAEDISGNSLSRLYGQAGVRSSLPFWRVDPMVQSSLFNLNGLAHKVSLDADLFYADASENLDQLPLYDPVDDDATEHFRRRLFFNTFGGPGGVGGPNTPLQFDERYFLLRSGIQSWVTTPTMDVAEDLMIAKLALRQRWQTKRGLPGQERILDWIQLDVEGTLFPRNEDNFGESVGLLNYDFRWHLGDRFTVLSDGFADLFDDGLRTATLGAMINRPERGSLYLGYRTIDGPISSNIVVSTLSYRMTEKWIFTGGASYDFGNTGNIGQTFQLTRVGESALVRLGFTYDVSRDNLGINFAIEPRFLPSSRLGRVGGVQIPPAGAYGLE